MARGRRPLPWIKLWFDIIGDPKMAQLSAAEKWCWVGIILLAGQSPVRGKLMLADDKPMNENDIYRALRLSPKERKSLKTCIIKMTEMNSLKWDTDCLGVVHFKDRQEAFPSDFLDYHQKKSVKLTPDKLRKTPELTPDLLQKEGEGRGERGDIDKDITPLSLDKGARTKRADPVINEIFFEMRRFLGYPEKVCGGEALPAIEENQAMTAESSVDPIPNYGKEGKAIKRMLTRGFTREEILACWKSKVSQRGGEFVSMTWVNEDIGKKGGKGGGKQPRQERARPITYVKGAGENPGGKE